MISDPLPSRERVLAAVSIVNELVIWSFALRSNACACAGHKRISHSTR